MPSIVVQIDTVTQFATQPANTAGAPGGAVDLTDMEGPVVVGANVYLPLGHKVFAGILQMYKSTDGGLTWNAVGSSQTCRNFAVHFQASTGIFTFAYQDNTNAGSNNPVQLIQFNTATDTMGAPFGGVINQPSVSGIYCVRVRSNGDIVVLTRDSSGANTSYQRSVFSGGAWTVSAAGFDVTGNANAKTMSSCIDGNDTVHILVSVSSGAAYNVDYWNFSSANVITGPQSFLWITASNMNQNGVPKIEVSDAQDTVYTCQTRGTTDLQIFYGSPRSAPVWASLLNGTKIGSIPDLLDATPPYMTLGTDGNLYITVQHGPGGAAEFVDQFTAPASTAPLVWTQSTLIDQASTTPALTAFFTHSKIGIVTNGSGLYFDSAIASSVAIQRFRFGLPNPPPPPPPVAKNVLFPGGGGDQVIRGGCKPFNDFDWCLWKEALRWYRIRPNPVCSVPQQFWNLLPWEPDWGSLPGLAVPFRKIAGIITPAPAAGDTAVVTLIVPQGYDGILTGFFWRYQGINFVEGSGDIFWRIKVNQRFVKDLSNVGFTLGSSITPMPMTEGQALQPRQRLSIIVNVPNISGTIQVGASTITAGMFGFYWPKGVPGWEGR